MFKIEQPAASIPIFPYAFWNAEQSERLCSIQKSKSNYIQSAEISFLDQVLNYGINAAVHQGRIGADESGHGLVQPAMLAGPARIFC